MIYICVYFINLIVSMYEKYDVKNICLYKFLKLIILIDKGSYICDRVLFFCVIINFFCIYSI